MLGVTLWVLLGMVLVLGSLTLLRANRLDRLHVRSDAAAAALRSALDRRCVVARTIAAPQQPHIGAALRAVADAAEQAPVADREAAENELTSALAALPELPAALADELADAEQRVMIARRVYNDAVRATLAVRATRLVRWLRLAGTAGPPAYFEIAEQPIAGSRMTGAGAAAAPAERPAARVILFDRAGRVLLFEGIDPARTHEPFWFTVGGGIEPGEDLRTAALRELREETGLGMADEDLVGPIWKRDVLFSFNGKPHSSREWFFVAHHNGDKGGDKAGDKAGDNRDGSGSGSDDDGAGAGPAIDTSGFDDLEASTVLRHRWWSAEELRRTSEVYYPLQLAELLPAAASGWDGVTRVIR